MKNQGTTCLDDRSRREFFRQLVLGGTGVFLSPLLLQSCSSEDLGRPPFAVWEDMIKALEQSPDHFMGRRKTLVASKDPKAMTDFVRDSFQVLPWQSDFLHHAAYGSIYGTVMALRCGLATPREKAEILKDMLVDAGYEARVIMEETSISLEEAKAIVFRKYMPEFNPPVSEGKIKKWYKALGISAPQGGVDVIPDLLEQANSLSNKLLNTIDPKFIRDSIVNFRFHADAVPSVAFMDGEEEKYAHVFDPEVSFGNLHPTNTENHFYDAVEMRPVENEEVTLTLSCRRALDHWNETELLSGTWKLSELLGNQLQVQFLNNMTLVDQATRTVSQIAHFTPCFAVQCLNEEHGTAEERSVMGEPITMEGERIFETYSPSSLPESEEAGAIEKIHSFEARVLPQAFPKVRLELSPMDASGAIVEGLSINNFSVTDNGKPVSAWMKQNTISPKILLLYDTSASMPMEYAGEQIKMFLEKTEAAIRVAYPTVHLILQATGSNIYTALLKAKQLDVDLILYATDGDNNDEFDPAFTPIYENGPPAIFLNVKPQGTVYSYLRQNMEFIEIAADDQERTIVEIKHIVDGLEFPAYILTYTSFDETGDHIVDIAIKNTIHKTQLPYQFPEKSDHLLGNRMVGLYLTLSRRGKQPIKRVLAGYEPHLDFYGEPTKLTRKMIDEVHELILGGAVMSFEREAPTLSIQLTEYLQTLLSNKEWFEAYQDGNMETAIEKLNKGTHSYPALLLSMVQPLRNCFSKEGVTYPRGFRTSLIKFKPGYHSGNSNTSFDYFPTSDYITVTRTGTGNYVTTLNKTAQLAILEGEVFEKSTLSELSDKSLALNIDQNTFNGQLPVLKPKDLHYFSRQIFGGSTMKLFDIALNKRSYWKINTSTGELYGILPNQTGGGINSTEEQLKNLDTVVQEYSKLVAQMNLGMTMMGVGTMPVGIVATYSLTLVKLYALASEALILMDAKGMDDQLKEALANLACDVYKEILYVGFGRLGTGASTIENLIGAMGGSYSFVSC